MISQAKKMRSAWSNRSYDSKKNTQKKEELHSLITHAVERALKTDASGKKRDRSDDLDELDVFNVQEDFSHMSVANEGDDEHSA